MTKIRSEAYKELFGKYALTTRLMYVTGWAGGCQWVMTIANDGRSIKRSYPCKPTKRQQRQFKLHAKKNRACWARVSTAK